VPRLDLEAVIQQETGEGARCLDRPMIGMDDVNLEGRVDRRPESQAVGCAQYEAASAARLAHDRSQTLDEVPGIGDVFDDVRDENDGGPVTHQFRA
jgi:hypothetical protein